MIDEACAVWIQNNEDDIFRMSRRLSRTCRLALHSGGEVVMKLPKAIHSVWQGAKSAPWSFDLAEVSQPNLHLKM